MELATGFGRTGEIQVGGGQEMTDGRLNLKEKQKGGYRREPGFLERDLWTGKSLAPSEWWEGRKFPLVTSIFLVKGRWF